MEELAYPAAAARLGSVTIDPATPVVAGSVSCWTITLTVGTLGIDEGGTIKVAQRFASDWEPSQFDRPSETGYSTVSTTGRAKLRPRYDRKGHDRPWMQCVVIDVYDGSLAPGDTVTIVLGDQSKGSPGTRAQTFQESAHEFRVFVDPTNACVARAVAASPVVPVIAGPATELVCIVPTQSDDPAKHVFVKGQDKWGNPTPAPDDVVISRDGDRFIAGSERLNLTAHSNPTSTRGGTLKKFWGDLHAQSDATVGTGTEVEYFTFARDVARLDFCSHQGNDFQMTDADWRRLNDVVRAFHRDGSFVAFPGWEWSGNSTAGGDRNVWFLEEGMPMFRSSHWQVQSVPETQQSPAHNVGELFARVRKHVPLDKVLLGSHVGGRYADIKLHFDEELGPLVELVSCWGVFEWMLWDAFDCGYIVGVMCNSDGHKGRPGAEGPGAGQFGIANGLTCVLAEELTRSSVFRALKSRRCYGTTGARIDLDFAIDGQPMGSVFDAGADAHVMASVRGTAPIESLELYQGKQVIETVRPRAFVSLENSRRVRVSWRGSRIRGRGRRVRWDGTVRVTGAAIVSATSTFDTPIDRITRTGEHEVEFISQTTGDTDSIDLLLDNASTGVVALESKAGMCAVDLRELTNASPRKLFTFDGLDVSATIERYPEQPTERTVSLDTIVRPPAGKTTPYFVKVTQCDGQMAWASPVYLRRG
jgi:hypothetical protein